MHILRKTTVLVVLMLLCVLCAQLGGTLFASAETPLYGADGVYSVAVSNDLTMGGGYLSDRAEVEKIGDSYYASLTFDTSAMQNVRLVIDGMNAGCEVTHTDGTLVTYRYTLSAAHLAGELPFTVYVAAMKKDVTFRATLRLSEAEYVGAGEGEESERPAEFVPVFTTSAGSEYQLQQGAVFPVPAAAALLGTEECTVTVTAYYGGEEVTIANNCFTLEHAGEYRLVYRASSPSYLTSLGNDTYTLYEVKITSTVGGSSLARFEAAEGALPQGAAVMPGRITQGSTYTLAAEQMKSIADRFEVFEVKFISAQGDEVTPVGNIILYLQADSSFDRTEIAVYYLDGEGTLTELSASGYGRYVRFETDRTGTFVVCVPGVSFVMPMWGYAVILVCAVLVLAAAVTATVLIVRKRKRRAQA